MLYTRRNDGELIKEPVAVFEGEVNPLRVPEGTAEEQMTIALWGLAEMFVFELNQIRVYVKFDDHMLVLEDQRNEMEDCYVKFALKMGCGMERGWRERCYGGNFV
jgi:hypothetical protein